MVRGRTLSVQGESEVTSPAARVTAKVTGVMPPPSWSATSESADCAAANRPMATSSPTAPSVSRWCSRWSTDAGASNNDDPGDNVDDAAEAATSRVGEEAVVAEEAAAFMTRDSPASAIPEKAAAAVMVERARAVRRRRRRRRPGRREGVTAKPFTGFFVSDGCLITNIVFVRVVVVVHADGSGAKAVHPRTRLEMRNVMGASRSAPQTRARDGRDLASATRRRSTLSFFFETYTADSRVLLIFRGAGRLARFAANSDRDVSVYLAGTVISFFFFSGAKSHVAN